MAFSLHKFCEWLAGTPASSTIQDVTWIIPLTQTIGSAVMLDLRLFGLVGRSDSIAVAAKRFLPWIWWTLPVFLATGMILTVGEPSRELENPTFVKKMILLAFAIVVTGILQATLRRDPGFWEASAARTISVKFLALASLALFIAIVFAGRFIAYTNHP